MFDISTNITNSRNLLGKAEIEQSLNNQIEPNAFYLAAVVNTNDPLKLGRIQIRIPAIHGTARFQSFYLADSSLPWARPAIMSAAGNDMGSFLVPSTGSRVFVTFECNDLSKPLYFGGFFTKIGNKYKYYNDNSNIYTGEEIEITSDDRITDIDSEAYQIIYKSLKGSTILMNDKDGKESIKIIDAAGQQIVLENDSDEALPRRGNKTNPPKTASIKIKTNGTLKLDCDYFDLEANSTNLSTVLGGDKSFIFSQGTPSNEWNIQHNLQKYPSVLVLDSAGNLVEGNVRYIDTNNLTITFNSSFSGKASLN